MAYYRNYRQQRCPGKNGSIMLGRDASSPMMSVLGMSECEVPRKRARVNNSEEDEWRNSAPNFRSLIRSMFEQDIDTDIVAKVGVGVNMKDIECHSLVLSAHSPVMRAMLSRRWSEVTDEGQRIITLVDDDPDHFLHFVNMMYWDWSERAYECYRVPESPSVEITIGVLSLSNKYLATHVLRHAEHVIHCYLSEKSATTVVKMYMMLKNLPIGEMGQIGRKILRTVTNCLLACGQEIFGSDAILLLSQPKLACIVKNRLLQCPEQIIYSGCYKWAKEQCKLKRLPSIGKSLRFVLGNDIISCIRFPLLDKATVVNEVLPTKILNEEEALELLSYIVKKDCSNKTDNSIRFSTVKRDKGRKFRVSRLDKDHVSDYFVNFSSPHGFIMTSSKAFMLAGLEFYGGSETCKDYIIDVKIGILQKVVGRSIEMKNPNYGKARPENKTLKMEIRPKVKIPAQTPVKITFTIKGDSTIVSKESTESEIKELLYWKDELIVFNFKPSSDCPNGLNQVPTLLFTNCCPIIQE